MAVPLFPSWTNTLTKNQRPQIVQQKTLCMSPLDLIRVRVNRMIEKFSAKLQKIYWLHPQKWTRIPKLMIWKTYLLETMATFGIYVIFWGVYGVHVCFRWIISTCYHWINAACFAKYKIIHHWYLMVFVLFRGHKMCPFWGDQTMQTYVNFDEFLGFESAWVGLVSYNDPCCLLVPSLGFMMGFVCFHCFQNVTPPKTWIIWRDVG